MTTGLVALPLSELLANTPKKRRVLLVDMLPARSDLRAETMRKCGMEVDCAADLIEARSWWRADLYNLVLIDADTELGLRDVFCADVRGATPPQRLAFLVGKPGYLADEPNAAEVDSPACGDSPLSDGRLEQLADEGSNATSQRWGLLEACRQISAVRKMSDARAKAFRLRPAPARDCEPQRTKRPAAVFESSPELHGGEAQ